MTYVRYIDKTREYYRTQGYDKPYKWAHFEEAPFTSITKPLAKSRIALVSTGEVEVRDIELSEDENQMGNVGGVYSIPSSTPEDRLFSASHSYDKHATTLEDINAFFPAARLHEAVESGRISGLTERFIGVYNAYSQRRTMERDAPEVLRRLREDGADIAVMVPV